MGGLLKSRKYEIQDFPARAATINSILHSLAQLASRYDLIVFVSNHESKAPMSNYTSFYGGSSVGYGFKYSLYLKMGRDRDQRRLIGYRAPHIAPSGWELALKISDRGFEEHESEEDHG